MGKDAAVQKGIELVGDKLWLARIAGFDVNEGEERVEVFLHHAVGRGFFGTMPLGKSRAALTITHVNAAGIDIGSAAHFVAVPPDGDDEPVREFPSFTVDLNAIVGWLDACQVDTVAMESTGVYWIPAGDRGWRKLSAHSDLLFAGLDFKVAYG